jgi:hypothetical protein
VTTVSDENVSASQALAKIATDIQGMDVRTLATVLVRSGYFQDTREIAQATVKVLAGRELGFGPIASMQGVYIVKGRVSLAANLVAAAIQRSGRFRYRVTKLDKNGCAIKFYERWGNEQSWTEVGESTFDAQDAATAELGKGENYRHYPRNMYFARALTNGARWYCPEVFNGPVYTPDELGATVDDDGQVIDIPAAPPMDTAQVASLAREQARIFGTEEDRDKDGVPAREAPVDPLAQALLQHGALLDTAREIGVKGLRACTAEEGDGLARVLDLNRELEQRIRSRNSELDQQAALEQAER